jgi:hypothetical protein
LGNRDRLNRTLLAVVAAVLVAGCAGERRETGQDRPGAGAAAAVTGPQELTLPLDPYQPSPAHLDLLARARRTLLVRCMRRFGVDPAEALALLARIAGPERVAAEPAVAEALVGLCGHLPLAIRIAGARLPPP